LILAPGDVGAKGPTSLGDFQVDRDSVTFLVFDDLGVETEIFENDYQFLRGELLDRAGVALGVFVIVCMNNFPKMLEAAGRRATKRQLRDQDAIEGSVERMAAGARSCVVGRKRAGSQITSKDEYDETGDVSSFIRMVRAGSHITSTSEGAYETGDVSSFIQSK
jgi:hypothetical protein